MRRCLLALAVVAAPALAALSPADLSEVGSTPPSGALLPRLAFVDQDDRPYRLAPGRQPIVLLFADYTCGHICGPGITLTAGALHDAGKVAGRDYRMVVIGLDQDGPVLARALVAERLRSLPAEKRAMALLTGSPAMVVAAETELGYHAVYDREADQFAHDAAVYVFAPSGTLSSLLPETATTSDQMAAALARAQAGTPFVAPPPRSQSLGERISAICYGLAASRGVYARPIVLALRLGGIALCAGFAGFLLWTVRRRRGTA